MAASLLFTLELFSGFLFVFLSHPVTGFTVKLLNPNDGYGEVQTEGMSQKHLTNGNEPGKKPMGHDFYPVSSRKVEFHTSDLLGDENVLGPRKKVDLDEVDIKNSAVENFLVKYGYLGSYKNNLVTEEEKREAIRKFQEFAGLKVNGFIDKPTKNQMLMPRCGLTDPTVNLKLANFETATSRWTKKYLTYKITKYSEKVDREATRKAVAKAFLLWSKASSLTFTETDSDTVDLNISFQIGDHDDGAPFDGAGGVLGHAFYPELGLIHIDDAENFTLNSTEGINLMFVLVHEFGHAMGLGHSKVADAIMGPYYYGFVPNLDLNSDDVAGIQFLYGSPPSPTTKAPTTTAPTTTESTTIPVPTTTEEPRTRTITTLKPMVTSSASGNPIPPLPKDEIPHFFCKTRIRAAMSVHKFIFGFNRRSILKYTRSGEFIERTRVSDMFPHGPRKVWAAAYNEDKEQAFLFSGQKVYRYTDFELDPGFPKTIKYWIRAAFVIDDFLIAFSFTHIHYLDSDTLEDYVDGEVTISNEYPNLPLAMKGSFACGDGLACIVYPNRIFMLDVYTGATQVFECNRLRVYDGR